MTQTRIDIAKKGLQLGVHIGVNFYKVHKSEKTRKEIDIFRCWFDAQWMAETAADVAAKRSFSQLYDVIMSRNVFSYTAGGGKLILLVVYLKC